MRASILCAAIACSIILGLNFSARGDDPAVESAPAPASEFFPQPTEREARLGAVLAQPLSVNFADTPLSDVAAWFSSKLEVPVILDYRSLEDAGIGADTPVSRKADGISARTALKLVLDDLDLASLQKDGVLIVMSQDSAETELITRVYPVEDLTPLVEHWQSQGAIGKQTSIAGAAPEAASPEKLSPVPVMPAHRESSSKLGPDYNSLIEAITTTVKPQSWDEVGGAGSIVELLAAKSIVVSQTRDVHDEILELLRALRGAKRLGETTEAK